MNLVLGSGNTYTFVCNSLRGKKYIVAGPHPPDLENKEEIIANWYPLQHDAQELTFASSMRLQEHKFKFVYVCLDAQPSQEVELLGGVYSYLLSRYLQEALFKYVAILKSLSAIRALRKSYVLIITEYVPILYEQRVLDAIYYGSIESSLDADTELSKISVNKHNTVGYQVLEQHLKRSK